MKPGLFDLQKGLNYTENDSYMILGEKNSSKKLGDLNPNSVLSNPGIYIFIKKSLIEKIVYNKSHDKKFIVANDPYKQIFNETSLLQLFDSYGIKPYKQKKNSEEAIDKIEYKTVFEDTDYFWYLNGLDPAVEALWIEIDTPEMWKKLGLQDFKYSKKDVLSSALFVGLGAYREAAVLDEPINNHRTFQETDMNDAMKQLSESKKFRKHDFMDFDRQEMDQFLIELLQKEDPNDLRSFSDGGWSFSSNTPDGLSPSNVITKMVKLGYDDSVIIDAVPRMYVGFRPNNVKEFISLSRMRNRLGESQLREINLIGNCTEIGDSDELPYSDATEFEQDLENFHQISAKEFQMNCNTSKNFFKSGHEFDFFKRDEGDLYIAYDLDDDIHHFFM
jgi:hypothetical protein